METFTALKKIVDNPYYSDQRNESIHDLDINSIDHPIREVIEGFMTLPYCFTLQSCFGHFLYKGQQDTQNIALPPDSKDIKTVEYRIAYIAICIQDTEPGRALFKELSLVPRIDSRYIQFGCAEWFWERCLNSFALQVEPERYATKDSVVIGYQEALHIEKIRNTFYRKIEGIILQRRTDD